MASIFDFDQTITLLHTFFSRQLKDLDPTEFHEEHYIQGQIDAPTNMKEGLKEILKHDDNENLSAVATFHNNHSYIAGYISVLFGKKLIFQSSVFSQDGFSAVASYKIEGIDKPFLISYVPAVNPDYGNKLDHLGNNKNPQINHLRSIFELPEFKLSAEEIISLYDDALFNCQKASELAGIKANLVDPAAKHFTFSEEIPPAIASSSSSSYSFFS